MREDFSVIRNSKIYKFFLIWHFTALVFAGIIGIATSDYSLFLSLSIWTVIATVAYKFHPKFYIVSVMFLATIEEWLVYQFGGGLQGEAISLLHDFVNALPVFFGMAIAWYIVTKRYQISEVTLFIMAGLLGSFVELFFQGIIFQPVLLFLLGGPNFFIYGSIFVSPQIPAGEREIGKIGKVGAWFFAFLWLLIGAIVADNLNQAFGFP